tara:strand:- start:2024 stop:2695 length:672 start_codon:yes stop_codon:yes gene_type:complete
VLQLNCSKEQEKNKMTNETMGRHEVGMFGRWQQYLQAGLARALEEGREFGVVHQDEILPYSSELRFLHRARSFFEGIDTPLVFSSEGGELSVPGYTETRSRILEGLGPLLNSEEEQARMGEVRNLSWEYTRDLNSAAYCTNRLLESNHQEALAERVRIRNRENSERELRRLIGIQINSNNLGNLLQELTEIREDYLYESRDSLALSAKIHSSYRDRMARISRR